MEFFLDTANLNEIQRWLGFGVIDGVTTNPTIMMRGGITDVMGHTREIARTIGSLPLSAEVTTNDFDEMIVEARQLAAIAPNIVIKIPIINETGGPALGVIHTLATEGIKVNATAILSFGQAMLAAKAGATYVSIFAGRIADEGGDSSAVIARTADWLERWDSPARIIVGSVRETMNVQDAAEAGAHIITVPPALLEKLIDHRYSRDTVRGFNEDARAVRLAAQAAQTAQAGR